MGDTEINDVRGPTEFKGISFSGFQKTKVEKELMTSLFDSKIESACYWSAELICAGHFADLWETIFTFFAKHIHVAHPKLVTYLELRVNHFKQLVTHDLLPLRNNDSVRNLFCEIMCIFCESKKSHTCTPVKVRREDFDLTQLTDRFHAPNLSFSEAVMMPHDPKELVISINELAYNVSEQGKNGVQACYWMEWIMEFERIGKEQKTICRANRREFANVDLKFQTDPVWIIWDILLHEVESRENQPLLLRIVRSTLQLFCLRYRGGATCFKKRRLLMYFVVHLVTESSFLHCCSLEDSWVVKDKTKVSIIQQNLPKLYRQIKQNEQVIEQEQEQAVNPKGKKQSSNVRHWKQTVAKLEIMHSLGADYLPRY